MGDPMEKKLFDTTYYNKNFNNFIEMQMQYKGIFVIGWTASVQNDISSKWRHFRSNVFSPWDMFRQRHSHIIKLTESFVW